MKVVAILFMTLGLALASVSLSEREKPVEREVAHHEGGNYTQCMYREETKMLSCRGVSGEVECPAIFEWTGEKSYKIFGMGFVPEFRDVKSELVRYWLYPRSFDNSTYFNHSIITEEGERDLFLYYGEKMVEYGFRVTDLKCWERLFGLIKMSSVEHMCSLEGEKGEVPLIGETLILDSEVSKRWLFGYGFGGLGLGMGWGYRGFGYGYPYGLGYWGRK